MSYDDPIFNNFAPEYHDVSDSEEKWWETPTAAEHKQWTESLSFEERTWFEGFCKEFTDSRRKYGLSQNKYNFDHKECDAYVDERFSQGPLAKRHDEVMPHFFFVIDPPAVKPTHAAESYHKQDSTPGASASDEAPLTAESHAKWVETLNATQKAEYAKALESWNNITSSNPYKELRKIEKLESQIGKTSLPGGAAELRLHLAWEKSQASQQPGRCASSSAGLSDPSETAQRRVSGSGFSYAGAKAGRERQ